MRRNDATRKKRNSGKLLALCLLALPLSLSAQEIGCKAVTFGKNDPVINILSSGKSIVKGKEVGMLDIWKVYEKGRYRVLLMKCPSTERVETWIMYNGKVTDKIEGDHFDEWVSKVEQKTN